MGLIIASKRISDDEMQRFVGAMYSAPIHFQSTQHWSCKCRQCDTLQIWKQVLYGH
jgi:hypothetical protein